MSVMFNTPYDGNRNRVSIDFLDDDGNPAIGRTEQHHADACDVNNILKQYDRTGLLSHVNEMKAHYGDFTEVNEYQESLNTVIYAQNAFDDLPSDVRKRFANDPGLFIEFVTNPSNIDEMVDIGLAVLPTPEEPTKVQIVSDVESPTES